MTSPDPLVVRYLSDEWITAVGKEVALDTALSDIAASFAVSVTQVVTATPFGDVSYHLLCRDGAVVFATGAVPSDVVFTQSYETAVGVATGRINAAEAFIHGHVQFKGDHQRVIDAQPVFAALDAVFGRVRSRTVFN